MDSFLVVDAEYIHFRELSELITRRRSCKAFYNTVAHQLFSRFHVTSGSHEVPPMYRYPFQTAFKNLKEVYPYKRFHSILSSPHLSPEVVRIKITTLEEQSKLTELFEVGGWCIRRFPDVRDFAVEFAQLCVVGNDLEDARRMIAHETVEFRYIALRTLFEVFAVGGHVISMRSSLGLLRLRTVWPNN